jgi:hypothetical protein
MNCLLVASGAKLFDFSALWMVLFILRADIVFFATNCAFKDDVIAHFTHLIFQIAYKY